MSSTGRPPGPAAGRGEKKQPGRPPRETWRSPAGISAVAAAVTCVLGVMTFLFVDLVNRPAQPATGTATTAGATTSPRSTAGEERLVFVYGTSMPGEVRYSYIEPFVESHEPAEVTGFLYDSGAGYPAAKFGPGDPIPGYLLTLRAASARDFFTQMTQVEAGLFDLVEVTTDSGTRARSYEWIGPTDGLQRIPQWDGQ